LLAILSVLPLTAAASAPVSIGPAPGVLQSRPSAAHRLIERGADRYEWMTEAQVAELKQEIHEREGHCGGFFDVTEHPTQTRLEVAPPFELFTATGPSHEPIVEPLLRSLSAQRLVAHIEHLSAYNNRYYTSDTGVQAAEWIRDQFATLAARRADVKVELFKHSFAQPSVIATIQGSGPRADEVVIIGGHEDSIRLGLFPTKARAPGADDDASGVATVLETFRVLMESGYRPDRTLVFMTYAGEEKGLLGSQDIAAAWQKQKRQVVGVLQLDMTFYPGRAKQMTFITDNTTAVLNRFTQSLMDHYVKMPWREGKCGYGCSDHASWNRLGYPAVFPFEAKIGEDNPRIHTSNDTLEGLDAEFGLQFAQLATAFAVEMTAQADSR
jgi:leucyl aminopeptidase